MKKLFLAVLCSAVLCVSLAVAGPFLVCDPQKNVTSYIVVLDGEAQEVVAQDMGDNTTRLHFDLAEVSEGSHNATVAAKNIWGESEPVPFFFESAVPGSACVLGLTAQ